jgi:ABC-2 type transport system permease protein
MFRKIFVFEVQNRLRRPAVYLYFAAALIFTVFTFANGYLPLGEKEHINAPYVIALWCAGITMLMMLVSSSIMGQPLYRDIENNTKDYYLTYPITKAGYFWGRYLGSFVFMLFIASAIIIGAYLGTKLGPAMGWKDAKEYGPNKLIYYLHPFFVVALPNLFFTSSLFFGLVALTRNVKVIYSGGILLFLGYFLSIFFLNHTNNATVIINSDPFGVNAVRLLSGNTTSVEKNTTLFPVEGAFLANRLIWTGLGLGILLFTYFRFNFERFFSGKRDRSVIDDVAVKTKRSLVLNTKVNFSGNYNRKTLFNLARVELTNIIRDNYFWIILLSGIGFLLFAFWMGENNYGVAYFPRTVTLLAIFNDVFPFFIFFIIIFYTGETLHRDQVTRYAFINDSLPPPNWVLNGSKLLALLMLGFGLSLVPLIGAMAVQTAKGFYHYHLAIMFTFVFTILLPRLLEMVIFSYMVHVVVNNKFVAHGIGIAFWVLVFFLNVTGTFNYNLLIYSYTPWYGISDMDGVGHMLAPVYWFNLYWLLFAGLLVIVSGLFYYRGVSSSFKERLKLLGERFDTKTRLFTAVVAIAFLAVGAWNHYNISYLNAFLTKGEIDDRAVIYEKTLKKYASLPLPKVTRVVMDADLYPDKQQEFVKALVTIFNKTDKPISQLLLDGDELTDYSVKTAGKPVPFTYPLTYRRGMFNWFRPKLDTAEFRLYQFEKPLLPGDSAVMEFSSSISYKGFQNGLYAKNLLHNGTFFNGGLPGLGYDEDDEQNSNYERKKHGLPEKHEGEIPQNDAMGISTLKSGAASDLMAIDLTVSTSGDQSVVATGDLKKQWTQNGRNYYHFVQDKPGMYAPLAMVSARFANQHQRIQLDHPVDVDIYYHPEHNFNIDRMMAAYKDGLRYYAKAFGSYPFNSIRLAETSQFSPRDASITTMDTYAEYYGWTAHFESADQFDFVYFNTTRELAQQWWRYQVAPNSTVGSLVIPEGLASYSALVLAEKKYGRDNMKWILRDQVDFYTFIRRRMEGKEHPLVKADQWYIWGGKAGLALYTLKDLMGEDSLNAALRDFKDAYAFKKQAPFAGSNDLYRYLQKHVPDSLQYYLTDTWQKITLYDNKVTELKAIPTGKNNLYKVTLTVNVDKVWIDDKGNDVPAKNMNDYIDIGVFAANVINKEGRTVTSPLYLQRYKLTAGKHTVNIMVKGKPVNAGIDPYNKLIDRIPDDNVKDF